jgi:hypothetical protein
MSTTEHAPRIMRESEYLSGPDQAGDIFIAACECGWVSDQDDATRQLANGRYNATHAGQ